MNQDKFQLARNSYYNPDTKTREKYTLLGSIPCGTEKQNQQEIRALKYVNSRSTDLEKYIALTNLKNTNDMAPLIYTPTVGAACVEYSNIQPFLGPVGHDGLFISIDDIKENKVETIFNNYKKQLMNPSDIPSICVVTDGSRILGLGDLGINGMGIPVGKLALYVACGGIDSNKTLPITLDLGTNTEKYLKDDNYIGIRRKRPEAEEVVDQFLNCLERSFPNILIQFEDFSTEHAFGLLEKHRNNRLCFNDDIQGTAAVVMAGVINAIKLTGIKPSEHKVLFFGAGSAAVGVANLIWEYLKSQCVDVEKDKMKENIFLMDSQGLVTSDRKEMAEHKKFFATSLYDGKDKKDISQCIKLVGATILIGLSSVRGAFNETVLKTMKEQNDKPIIFSLSNPKDNSECTFEEAMKATDCKVIFASGTAFPKYVEPKSGKEYFPGQGNNMYIFPGLGLGTILAKCKIVSEEMVFTSATVLSDCLNENEKACGLLYPRVERIREVSAKVACGVMKSAHKSGLVTDVEMKTLIEKSEVEIMKFVEKSQWSPYPNTFFD